MDIFLTSELAIFCNVVLKQLILTILNKSGIYLPAYKTYVLDLSFVIGRVLMLLVTFALIKRSFSTRDSSAQNIGTEAQLT